jgi:Flp pilus assembly pilin Flp
MNLKNIGKRIIKKFKEFFSDNYGGNLVEYALLLGFAFFIFFLVFSIISSIMDWTLGLSNDFFNLFGG